MVLEPKNAVKGVVVSYRQGEPHGEIMLVTDDGKSQVLSLSIPLLGKLLEQSAVALARAASQLPIPPRKMDTGELLRLAAKQELEAISPVTRGDHEVMKDVCKILKGDDNGGPARENSTLRNQEYADVANRTQAAPDSVAWNRRVSPRLAVSKRTPSRDA
jgi:hypothetical protein